MQLDVESIYNNINFFSIFQTQMVLGYFYLGLVMVLDFLPATPATKLQGLRIQIPQMLGAQPICIMKAIANNCHNYLQSTFYIHLLLFRTTFQPQDQKSPLLLLPYFIRKQNLPNTNFPTRFYVNPHPPLLPPPDHFCVFLFSFLPATCLHSLYPLSLPHLPHLSLLLLLTKNFFFGLKN